jgi:hypothetical protein
MVGGYILLIERGILITHKHRIGTSRDTISDIGIIGDKQLEAQDIA